MPNVSDYCKNCGTVEWECKCKNPQGVMRWNITHRPIRDNDIETLVKRIKYGVDPNYVVDDISLLQFAINLEHNEIAKKLIELGADVNLPNSKGMTPLHYAAKRNNHEIAAFLLEKGAKIDPETTDWIVGDWFCPKGATPLYIAASQGSKNVAIMLAENGANCYKQALNNISPLSRASNWKSMQLQKLIIWAEERYINAKKF